MKNIITKQVEICFFLVVTFCFLKLDVYSLGFTLIAIATKLEDLQNEPKERVLIYYFEAFQCS